jgi:type I restriction enzyme S subunit
MSEEELPEGWAKSLISEVTADVPSKDPTDDPDRIFAYIDISAIDNQRFTITSDEVKRFRGRDAPSRARRPVRPGDVLYSNVRTYLRNIALVPAGVPADLCSTGFTVLRSNGVIEPEYLFRWVLTEEFLELISPHETGTHYPATSDRAVRSIPIRVPPLAEQRRIVEKVEALLAQVDAARARLAKVPTILKRFRKAVFAAACAGRLTETWRESAVPDANAEDEIPRGWRSVTIGQVAESLDNLRRPINKDERAGRAGTIPYYGANGRVGWIDDWIFDETLVLVVEDETFIGREMPFSYVIQGRSWVNNHAHVLRPIDGMTADYLNICLAYYDFIPLTSGTTGRRKLTKGTLMAAPLTVAPLEEQHEIVRRVDALFKLADAIEARVAAATARADNITQAILAKAFRGELVPTEAELAHQEGRDYEPASALLARLRAAHAANDEKPTRRPRVSAATPAPARAKPARQRTNGRTARSR